MYKIDDRTWAVEGGESVAFVRDGGGSLKVFAGSRAAMLSAPDPDGGPHTITDAEYVVLEVRG